MGNMIEVGEYIRNNKIIAKVIGTDDDNNILLDIQQILTKPEEKTVKHSKQLIDLIEVGDIVKDKNNKYEVAFVKDDKIYCNDYNLDDSLITLREQDIKEILAREQFEANCYKVGGEKC